MSVLYPTQRTPWFKTAMASILIVTTLFMFTPKKSDAILLALIGAATAGAAVALIVTELVIICALICGGGGSGGSGGPTPGDGGTGTPGDGCNSPANACGEFTGGTYNASGVCSATKPNDFNGASCVTAANYCGMTNSGSRYCSLTDATYGSTCGSGDTPLSPPPDSACTSLPLPPDALTANPPVVRIGDEVTISWNLGDNFPPNCTITGTGVSGTIFTDTDRTGSRTFTVSGPHQYNLTCGASSAQLNLIVLPTIYES